MIKAEYTRNESLDTRTHIHTYTYTYTRAQRYRTMDARTQLTCENIVRALLAKRITEVYIKRAREYAGEERGEIEHALNNNDIIKSNKKQKKTSISYMQSRDEEGTHARTRIYYIIYI